MKRFLQHTLILCLTAACSMAYGQTGTSPSDSTFWYLSLPEIQSYRAYYVQELDALQQEKQMLIQRGINDGERLLNAGPDPSIIDKILIRLADLYYYKEKDDFLNAMDDYDLVLERRDRGETVSLPPEPVLKCTKSLSIYQRIIDEFAGSPLVDDAIYNKAFLFEETGEYQKAVQVYNHLIESYPGSQYVPEAYMRLGEYYFNPPRNDLQQAIAHYNAILDYPGSPRYDEAMYKLGWSHYRLSQYPEAISYFTTLVDNFETMTTFDSPGLQIRPDLRNEAVSYIAISFLDFGGPEKLFEYVNGIGKPRWGEDALEKLGDILMDEKEEYQDAVNAYNTFLAYAPGSEQAPLVQQRIIECYRLLEDEARQFEMRQKLFDSYSMGTSWWQNASDNNTKLKAHELAEKALRENINQLMEVAETRGNQEIFEKAVTLASQYLEAFPEDVYAYMVRWNLALVLDTKLHRYKEALQEYLTISMVYNNQQYEDFARSKGLAMVKDAAENAVIVADSMVSIERGRVAERAAPAQLSGAGDKPAEPLSSAESWLAMAYDNYIKLFPFDQNTPVLLANAGALYYSRNQYGEALKYFNTLVKYFPDSEQVQEVKLSIIESYFAKQDYESVEALAKRLLSGGGLSEEVKTRIERRKAEALFLRAQQLADAGNSEKAADEYHRLALEAPSVDFADRALFNAGVEYERLNKHDQAIQVYERMRVSYEGSPLLPDVLNNLAIDYGEVGDYQKGAERYEALAAIPGDQERSRNALHNSIALYARAEKWAKAADLGKHYADRFREAPNADSLYFLASVYYELAGERARAAGVYSGFLSLFPESPFTVEAGYRLGLHYLNTNSKDAAENTFKQAYDRYQSLREKGYEANAFYAGEALFLATDLVTERYKSVTFKLPERDLNASVDLKQSLLTQIVDQLTRVANLKTERLPEALYRIGEAYEHFANTWAAQENRMQDATSMAVKQREIDARTTEVFSNALAAYGRSADLIRNILADPDHADSGNASNDSLITTMAGWLDRSNIKVSETLYQMAEVNTSSIEGFLKAPIPSELGALERLEYRKQVLELAVSPVLNIVVEAHRRNLYVADSLNISNAWTRASEEKIQSALGFLGSKFTELSLDALSGYRIESSNYQRNTIREKTAAPEAVVTSIINYIDLSKTYMAKAVQAYTNGISSGTRIGLADVTQLDLQNDMINSVLVMADSLESCLDQGMTDERRAAALFDNTGEIYVEDMLTVIEDNVFFLKENLSALLGSTHQMSQRLKMRSTQWGWISAKLVRMDPVNNPASYNIEVAKLAVPTDTTWTYSAAHENGWESSTVNERRWLRAKHVEGLRIIASMPADRTASGFYVRKEIDIPGIPVSGQVRFVDGQPDRLYVNGELLSEKETNKSINLTDFLKEGRNLLALQCASGDSLLEGGATIQYIPRAMALKKE